MKNRRAPWTRPIVYLAAAVSVIHLFAAGCQTRKGSKSPDLVVFATGNLFGQLQTCG